jgi:hypothetical protein
MPNFTLIEKYFLLINFFSDKQTYKNLKIDFQTNMNLRNTQRREGKIVFKRQFLSLRRDVKKKKKTYAHALSGPIASNTMFILMFLW